MIRRADSTLRSGADAGSGSELDDAWDEMPSSTALPLRAAPRTPVPTSTRAPFRPASPSTAPAASHTVPPASGLRPVTIAPRPRPSSRAPAAPSTFPPSLNDGDARRALLAASGTSAGDDDPTIEISFQYLDVELLEDSETRS
jgi:hypothetical protein